MYTYVCLIYTDTSIAEVTYQNVAEPSVMSRSASAHHVLPSSGDIPDNELQTLTVNKKGTNSGKKKRIKRVVSSSSEEPSEDEDYDFEELSAKEKRKKVAKFLLLESENVSRRKRKAVDDTDGSSTPNTDDLEFLDDAPQPKESPSKYIRQQAMQNESSDDAEDMVKQLEARQALRRDLKRRKRVQERKSSTRNNMITNYMSSTVPKENTVLMGFGSRVKLTTYKRVTISGQSYRLLAQHPLLLDIPKSMLTYIWNQTRRMDLEEETRTRYERLHKKLVAFTQYETHPPPGDTVRTIPQIFYCMQEKQWNPEVTRTMGMFHTISDPTDVNHYQWEHVLDQTQFPAALRGSLFGENTLYEFDTRRSIRQIAMTIAVYTQETTHLYIGNSHYAKYVEDVAKMVSEKYRIPGLDANTVQELLCEGNLTAVIETLEMAFTAEFDAAVKIEIVRSTRDKTTTDEMIKKMITATYYGNTLYSTQSQKLKLLQRNLHLLILHLLFISHMKNTVDNNKAQFEGSYYFEVYESRYKETSQKNGKMLRVGMYILASIVNQHVISVLRNAFLEKPFQVTFCGVAGDAIFLQFTPNDSSRVIDTDDIKQLMVNMTTYLKEQTRGCTNLFLGTTDDTVKSCVSGFNILFRCTKLANTYTKHTHEDVVMGTYSQSDLGDAVGSLDHNVWFLSEDAAIVHTENPQMDISSDACTSDSDTIVPMRAPSREDDSITIGTNTTTPSVDNEGTPLTMETMRDIESLLANVSDMDESLHDDGDTNVDQQACSQHKEDDGMASDIEGVSDAPENEPEGDANADNEDGDGDAHANTGDGDGDGDGDNSDDSNDDGDSEDDTDMDSYVDDDESEVEDALLDTVPLLHSIQEEQPFAHEDDEQQDHTDNKLMLPPNSSTYGASMNANGCNTLLPFHGNVQNYMRQFVMDAPICKKGERSQFMLTLLSLLNKIGAFNNGDLVYLMVGYASYGGGSGSFYRHIRGKYDDRVVEEAFSYTSLYEYAYTLLPWAALAAKHGITPVGHYKSTFIRTCLFGDQNGRTEPLPGIFPFITITLPGKHHMENSMMPMQDCIYVFGRTNTGTPIIRNEHGKGLPYCFLLHYEELPDYGVPDNFRFINTRVHDVSYVDILSSLNAPTANIDVIPSLDDNYRACWRNVAQTTQGALLLTQIAQPEIQKYEMTHYGDVYIPGKTYLFEYNRHRDAITDDNVDTLCLISAHALRQMCYSTANKILMIIGDTQTQKSTLIMTLTHIFNRDVTNNVFTLVDPDSDTTTKMGGCVRSNMNHYIDTHANLKQVIVNSDAKHGAVFFNKLSQVQTLHLASPVEPKVVVREMYKAAAAVPYHGALIAALNPTEEHGIDPHRYFAGLNDLVAMKSRTTPIYFPYSLGNDRVHVVDDPKSGPNAYNTRGKYSIVKESATANIPSKETLAFLIWASYAYVDMFNEISSDSNEIIPRGTLGLNRLRDRMQYHISSTGCERLQWATNHVRPIKRSRNMRETPIQSGFNTVNITEMCTLGSLYGDVKNGYLAHKKRIPCHEPYNQTCFRVFMEKYIATHKRYSLVNVHYCIKCNNGYVNMFKETDVKSPTLKKKLKAKLRTDKNYCCTHNKLCVYKNFRYDTFVYNMNLIPYTPTNTPTPSA